MTWSVVYCTCSWTSSKSELSISMKMGTAPAWITTRVWWDVPEAMFVKTHAASNCRDTTPLSQWLDLLLLYFSGKAECLHTHSFNMSHHKSIPSGVSNWLMAVVGLRAQNGILAVQHSEEWGGVGCVYCQSDPTFTLASHALILYSV